MNLPLHIQLEDVQNTPDQRCLPIDRVGIKSLRYPVLFQASATESPIRVVADFNMYVQLAHDVKGTHMSRFVELLETPDLVISPDTLSDFMQQMLALLEAQSGQLEMQFAYFMRKSAPISGVSSMMDYQVSLIANVDPEFSLTAKIAIPVTSLCPCSKKIAEYGAHNQRSLVTISVELIEQMSLPELITLIESQASSQLYGLLKRPDEKYVTEYAYDNPKFVEDLVRDVAASLNQCAAVDRYVVECENFESIHNHSAYAMLQGGRGRS
ncbi:GTP cyclohydrolase FolE2 [Methylophaga lonarensis]|uniref:GTP cyclohydrolase FolE2 n=1 Tax=Methylophaga lonarensis TaxID=999151 RepID=UPI003D2A3B1F